MSKSPLGVTFNYRRVHEIQTRSIFRGASERKKEGGQGLREACTGQAGKVRKDGGVVRGGGRGGGGARVNIVTENQSVKTTKKKNKNTETESRS